MFKDDATRLRHMLDASREACDFINLDIVWETVQRDLPPLAQTLQEVIGSS